MQSHTIDIDSNAKNWEYTHTYNVMQMQINDVIQMTLLQVSLRGVFVASQCLKRNPRNPKNSMILKGASSIHERFPQRSLSNQSPGKY